MGRSGNPAARPKYRGLPVPWVARTIGEQPGVVTNPVVDVKLGRAVAIVSADTYRDERGIWWCPSQNGRDDTPQFAALHPERQRRCFDERRCQVCGLRIKGRLTFVIEERNLGQPTAHPPVCGKCIPTVLRLCPHWRHTPPAIVTVEDFEVVGVYGDEVSVVNGEITMLPPRNILITDERIKRVFAKQLIVDLKGIRRIDQQESA